MNPVIDMKVFYLDSFLVLNLIIDYLLLILTAKLCHIQVKRSTILFSAAIGAVFAAGMFFFSGRLLIKLLLTAVATWIMITIVFSETVISKRLRLCGIFLLESFGFSGCMSVLQNVGVGRIAVQNGIAYIQIEFWQILVSALGAYLLFRFCFRDHSLKLEKQRVYLHAELENKTVEVMLLVDSGNLLREPLSGKPVILLAPEIAGKLLPSEAAALLKHPGWDATAVMSMLVERGITTRVIPIHTAGENQCLSLAVKLDDITLKSKGKIRKTDDYWLGIARSNIDVCGGCRGLIGI